MKRQFVEALQEGDRINDYFLAVRKDLRDQRNGGKFLGMVFKDKTGEIGGILWNNAAAVAKLFELGDVVNVQGSVTSYQGRLQVRVDQVLPLREGEFDLSDLSYVPETLDKTLTEFIQIMRSVKNEWLARLIDSFLSDEAFMNAFAEAAAGKKWHHAYTGGLAQHCLELAKLADAVCTIFPGVDRDMLLTGILVHDIGKIAEMSHGIYVDDTTPESCWAISPSAPTWSRNGSAQSRVSPKPCGCRSFTAFSRTMGSWPTARRWSPKPSKPWPCTTSITSARSSTPLTASSRKPNSADRTGPSTLGSSIAPSGPRKASREPGMAATLPV